jgi:hypothetical protein
MKVFFQLRCVHIILLKMVDIYTLDNILYLHIQDLPNTIRRVEGQKWKLFFLFTMRKNKQKALYESRGIYIQKYDTKFNLN